jgi:hypothetical protein
VRTAKKIKELDDAEAKKKASDNRNKRACIRKVSKEGKPAKKKSYRTLKSENKPVAIDIFSFY